MRGTIQNWYVAAASGVIAGDDGRRYTVVQSALRSAAQPTVGAAVEFQAAGDAATDVYLLAAPVAYDAAPTASGLMPRTQAEWVSLFFSPNGRIPRSVFWAAWGIQLGAGFLLGLIPLIGFFVSMVLVWTNICVNTKRLHDMGRTGWWQVAPWIATIVGFGALFVFAINSSFSEGARGDNLAVGVGAFSALGAYVVVNIGFLIWIGATPSQPHDNRFGPPPGRNIAGAFD